MVEVEVKYSLKIGDLFVESVGRNGITLTTRSDSAMKFYVEDDSYLHEQRIFDTILKIGEHGIGSQSVKIIEYKVITEYVNREVELFYANEHSLKLRGVIEKDVVSHLCEDDSNE